MSAANRLPPILPPPPAMRANLKQLHLCQTGEGVWECSWITTTGKWQAKDLTWPQVEAIIEKVTAT